MAEAVMVYDTRPDSREDYTEVQIDVLDGNGEYINSVSVRVDGKITRVTLAKADRCGPAQSGRGG